MNRQDWGSRVASDVTAQAKAQAQAQAQAQRQNGAVVAWLRALDQALRSQPKARNRWRFLVVSGRADGSLEVFQRRGTEVRRLGAIDEAGVADAALQPKMKRIGTDRRDVVLRLSPDQVIARTLFVPDAASDLLTPIVTNQIERLGPWSLDQALFDYRHTGQRSPDGRIEIAVDITGKTLVHGLLDRLAAHGVKPAIVDVGGRHDVQIGPVNLLRHVPDPDSRRIRRSAALVGVTVLAAGAVAAIGAQAAWQTWAQLSQVEARADALRVRAGKTQDLAAQVGALQDRARRLVDARSQTPPLVVVIELLSRKLPQNTYLERLDYNGETLVIRGLSTNVPRVMKALQDSGHFRQVRLSGATSRDRRTGRERFRIALRPMTQVSLPR